MNAVVPGNHTTTNMRAHLIKRHGINLKNSSPTSNSVISLLQQQGSKQATHRFEDNLVRWIVADAMAFSSIESPFFQQMIDDIPGLSMPFRSRNTLAARITTEFEVSRQQLTQELANSCQTIALSLDGWTSSNDISILGVIGHWLTKDFEYREVVLEFREVEGSKSGENMGRIILNLLHELDLEYKLVSITGDSASSNETLVDEVATGLREKLQDSPNRPHFQGQGSYIRRLAHVLHRIVTKILETLKGGNRRLAEEAVGLISRHEYRNTTESALARLRALAVWISWTPERKSQWRNLCRDSGLADALLPYDIDTRWNSTYSILETGIKARRQISRWIASQSAMPPFTEEDWEFLQQLSLILQRFHEHTEHVSRSAPQISYAVPVYYDLHDLIHDASAREGDFRTLHDEIAAAVSSALARYAKYYDFMDSLDIYYIALILNPRYKTWLLEQELKDDAALIIQHVKELLHREFPATAQASIPPPLSHRTLETRLLSKIHPVTSSVSDIDRYFNDPLAQVTEESARDPHWQFKWWRVHEGEYPRMAAIARKYLPIPASEVSVERLFSSAKDIIGMRRVSLQAPTLRQILLLRCSLKGGQSSDTR